MKESIWVLNEIYTYNRRPAELESMVYKDKEEAVNDLNENRNKALKEDKSYDLYTSTKQDDLLFYHYIGDDGEAIFYLEYFDF